MGKTSIEWTDQSVNPIRARLKSGGKTGRRLGSGDGHYCERVSTECDHCYAATFQPRFGMPTFGQGERLKDVVPYIDRAALDEVIRRRKPSKWFWCDMSDLFGRWVPVEWIDQCFAAMALTGRHTHQVLTKRAGAMLAYLNDDDTPKRVKKSALALAMALRRAVNGTFIWPGWPLPNVWVGVSAGRQAFADARIPQLLKAQAAVRFVSAEPLLGQLNLKPHFFSLDHVRNPGLCAGCGHGHGFVRCPNYGSVAKECHKCDCDCPGFVRTLGQGIDWVIVGGESGPGARPCHPDWIRGLRDQCQAAGVAFFFKQWGAWAPSSSGWDEEEEAKGYHMMDATGTEIPAGHSGGEMFYRVGKKAAGRVLDGREWSEFPEVTRAG